MQASTSVRANPPPGHGGSIALSERQQVLESSALAVVGQHHHQRVGDQLLAATPEVDKRFPSRSAARPPGGELMAAGETTSPTPYLQAVR